MSEGKPEAIPARIGDACFMDLTPIAQGGSQLQQSDLVSKINVRVRHASTSVRHVGDVPFWCGEVETCKMMRETERRNQEFPVERDEQKNEKDERENNKNISSPPSPRGLFPTLIHRDECRVIGKCGCVAELTRL